MTDDLGRELRERLGLATLPAAPSSLREEIASLRAMAPPAPVRRRFGRGRGMTLLVAAALLLGGGALAAGSGILRLPSVVPPQPAPSVVAIATASPNATSPSPIESAAPSASPIPAAGPGGVWIPTGTMGTPRSEHAAVRLLDGRVLVVGGNGAEPDPATPELYNPATGTWSFTGNTLKPPARFPPTLLLDGRVLVGDVDDPDPATEGDEIAGAEVYDPDSGTWSATGNMIQDTDTWCCATATLLRDGRVLVTGQGGAQVYDPDSGTWSATGNMITPRHFHTATLLRDGKVLAAGGYDGGDYRVDSAELYDPDTGSWTVIATPPWATGCDRPACPDGGWATLLQDGTLLLMSRRSESDAQIYDPAAGSWTDLAEGPAFGSPVALLSDGTVLMAVQGSREPCSAALYDLRTGSRTTTSSTLRCDFGSSYTLLVDGTVLVAGLNDCNESEDAVTGEHRTLCGSTSAAELYVPAGVSPPPLPPFPGPPPPVFPSPAPTPTPFPPSDGPVPPNARSWKVTVDNQSSEPATLFVAEEDEDGTLRLVGSATPNVVPAGATVKVTFLFPADSVPDDGWIYVSSRLETGSLVGAADIGIPGKIRIGAEGKVGWSSPPGS